MNDRLASCWLLVLAAAIPAQAQAASFSVPEPGELSLFALCVAVVAWRVHARQLRERD